MHSVIPASDCAAWRDLLLPLGDVDATYLPEYHLAYSLRTEHSQPLLFHFETEGGRFLYPFLLTPVVAGGDKTGYYDISGIYGYTGPIASSDEPGFLDAAWQAFDRYADEQKIIAEFVRFSPFNHSERFAHPRMEVEKNRTLAVSHLPHSEGELLKLLGAKTRNMLRKAGQSGLSARELTLPQHLPAFRELYSETMERNRAPEFFRYDDAYWQRLLLLGKGLRLFGVFAGEKLVASSMAVAHGKSALYHLGASLSEYAKQGAGNLSLYAMSLGLMASGVVFVNMTGGRTTAADDPLLLFKKSNATATATFYIGRRVINRAAYDDVAACWSKQAGRTPDAEKIIFWRP